MITKKNIIKIADAIKDLTVWEDSTGEKVVSFEAVVAKFSELIEAQNPEFMADRFEDYILGKCGPNGGKV